MKNRTEINNARVENTGASLRSNLLVLIKPFQANVPILYSLKTPGSSAMIHESIWERLCKHNSNFVG